MLFSPYILAAAAWIEKACGDIWMVVGTIAHMRRHSELRDRVAAFVETHRFRCDSTCRRRTRSSQNVRLAGRRRLSLTTLTTSLHAGD
jgi:hypothetical protein